MAYNTGNPVPSTDARDYVDNVENLDRFVNSLDSTATDRSGVTRSTWEGVVKGLSFFNVGTFAVGFTMSNSRQTLTYDGHEYGWSGVFPKVVDAGSTPTPLGSGGWIDRSDVTLRDDLASGEGANLVKYRDAYLQELFDSSPSPLAFGAPSNGVDDDAPAIIAALAVSKTIDMRGRTWKIATPITLPDGCAIDMRGASIVADVGSNPVFTYGVGGQGLVMAHGGGSITGTAYAFLRAVGSTNTPTSTSQYARNIRLHDLYISSTTIDWFIDAVDAVRQVFIDSCYVYTKNSVRAIGKCVEWKFNKCILFSSVGGTGTRGIVLQSPGSGSAYNEGWHFTDCTIDNFEKNQIDDIFVFTLNGGYLGTKTVFGQPTTTHCREIVIGNGAVLSEPVEFTPSLANDYRAAINPAMFTGVSGNCVLGNAGASGISVDTKFVSSVDGATAVRFVSGNSNCHVIASADATFERVVSFEGANGPRCSALIKSYLGGSNPVYTEHPVKIISPIVTNQAALAQDFVFSQVSGVFAVGATMGSVSTSLQKGTRGSIIVSLSLSGMSTTVDTQRLVVNPPSGMILPNGSGWNAQNIRPNYAQGMLYVEIPFYCSSDISAVSLSIVNSAGNPVTCGSHSFFGYRIL